MIVEHFVISIVVIQILYLLMYLQKHKGNISHTESYQFKKLMMRYATTNFDDTTIKTDNTNGKMTSIITKTNITVE